MDVSLDDVARGLASTRSRRSLLKGIVVAAAAVSAGRVFGAPGVLAAGNEQFVLDYYDAIQRHSWSKAYNVLGSKFHQKQTLQQFTDGFAETAFTSVEIGHVTGQLSGNRYGVDVVINAWLNDGTPQAFSGRYYIGREGGVTKIVDASIKVANTSGMAPLCFAGDLATELSGDAATGHRYGDLLVTNQGTTCTLAGLPHVTIKNNSNKALISGRREPGSVMRAVAIDGGQSGLLQLDWTNWCGSEITGDVKVAVTLAGHTGNFTVNHGFGIPGCFSEPGGASSLLFRPWQAS
jgi:hypothetical protein